MSNDLNRCEFIGRLGKDPETRYAPDGSPICNFSLAVGWKTKEKEGVEWIRVVAFGKLAEICGEYLTKGKQIFLSGRMTTRKWVDKDSGADRYATEIVADQMQMLGGREDAGTGNHNAAPPQQRPATQTRPAQQQAVQAASPIDLDSDIPF